MTNEHEWFSHISLHLMIFSQLPHLLLLLVSLFLLSSPSSSPPPCPLPSSSSPNSPTFFLHWVYWIADGFSIYLSWVIGVVKYVSRKEVKWCFHLKKKCKQFQDRSTKLFRTQTKIYYQSGEIVMWQSWNYEKTSNFWKSPNSSLYNL